jgi:hypothetical protein
MELNFRVLRADEIEARIARVTDKSVMILLYKDARCDMRILDETVGAMNWQRTHEVINGNLFCNVGIWREGSDGFGDWIWKQDVGTESNTEAQKGEASDSFKRACFNWGIGRELYTAPKITFWDNQCNIKDGKCYDFFDVTDIEYEDHKIIRLKVVNTKTKCVFSWSREKGQEKVEDVAEKKIDAAKVNVLKNDIKNGVIDEKALLNYFNVEKLEEVTEKQFLKYARQKEKQGK